MKFILLLLIVLPVWAQDEPPSREIEISDTGFITDQLGRSVRENASVSMEGVFLLTADRLIYDPEDNTVEAEGNVKIDYQTELGLIEVSAQSAYFNITQSAGYFKEVAVRFADEFYFVGEKLEMVENGEVYLITNGFATSCNQVSAQWSMKINSARVEKEGYAVVKGIRFRIKDLPVLYLPWMIAPVMQERRSGLLLPDTGGSERNGTYFSLPIYWAPRQDFDTTFTPHYHLDAGLQMGIETRYATRPDLSGIMRGSFFKDRVMEELLEEDKAPIEDGKPLSENRYRLTYWHRQQWKKGVLNIDVDAGSDFSVDRDFLQDAQSTRIRDYHWRAGYDRRVGRNALYVRLNRLDRILAVDEEVTGITHLPEFRFYMPNRHIGSGFHLRTYLYGDWFNYDDLVVAPGQEPLEGDLLRTGIDTELSRTIKRWQYVRLRWGARYQGAYYRGDNNPEDTEVVGGAFGFVETVGPRFSKIYRQGDKRLVHYVDAALSVKVGDREEDPFLESVLFDELDIRLNEQVDDVQTAWRVNSRIFAGPRGKVRPFMDLEISQDADIDGDEENKPIETRLRLINLGGFHANGIFDYDPDQGTIDTLSVYGSVNRGTDWQGYGGYVRRRAAGDIRQESFVGILQWNWTRFRSRFKAALDYNFETSEFKSQEFLYAYQGQCVGVQLNYVKSPFDSSEIGNQDFFRITLTLRNLANNIGTRF
ncbi:MAG: putative LPS assembly protein LptD [Acidobacteriota bacterium]|nr:putative LPS assembly protein LptD [Acidobacteriota bacterium]